MLRFDEEGIERMNAELADEAAAQPETTETGEVAQAAAPAAQTAPDINTSFNAQINK